MIQEKTVLQVGTLEHPVFTILSEVALNYTQLSLSCLSG